MEGEHVDTAGHLMRCAILQPFRPCLGGFVSLVSTFGRVLLAYSSHALGMSDFGLQEAFIMGGQNSPAVAVHIHLYF